MLEMFYMFVKTYILKKVNFTVCKLYLNKPDLEYTYITSLLGGGACGCEASKRTKGKASLCREVAIPYAPSVKNLTFDTGGNIFTSHCCCFLSANYGRWAKFSISVIQ